MSNRTPVNPLNISSHITAATRSRLSTSFEFTAGEWSKKNKANQDVYKKVKNAPDEAIAVTLVEDEVGQKLQFTYSNSIINKGEPKTVASFNLLSNMTLEWNVDPEFDKVQKRISMSAFSGLVIKSAGLDDLFLTWLKDDEFIDHAKTMASRLVYPPKLMKMILLWVAYMDIRSTQGWTEGQQLFDDMNVSLDKVGSKFKQMIFDFVGSVNYMLPYYAVPDTFRLCSSEEVAQLQPSENKTEPKVIESKELELVVLPDEPLPEIPEQEDEVVDVEPVSITPEVVDSVEEPERNPKPSKGKKQ